MEAHVKAKHSKNSKKKSKEKIILRRAPNSDPEEADVLECHFRDDVQCNFTSENRSVLLQHMRSEHDLQDDNLECNVCKKAMKNPYRLLDHFQEVHCASRPFKCDKCGLKFARSTNLKNHLKKSSCQKVSLKSVVSKPKTKRAFESDPSLLEMVDCFYNCGYSVMDRDDLEEHMRVSHGQDGYKCHICGRNCAKRFKFFAHHREVHMGLRPFVCDGCGMNFSRKSNMIKHQRKRACKGYEGHDIAEEFECDQCDKKFRYKQSLQQHVNRYYTKIWITYLHLLELKPSHGIWRWRLTNRISITIRDYGHF